VQRPQRQSRPPRQVGSICQWIRTALQEGKHKNQIRKHSISIRKREKHQQNTLRLVNFSLRSPASFIFFPSSLRTSPFLDHRPNKVSSTLVEKDFLQVETSSTCTFPSTHTENFRREKEFFMGDPSTTSNFSPFSFFYYVGALKPRQNCRLCFSPLSPKFVSTWASWISTVAAKWCKFNSRFPRLDIYSLVTANKRPNQMQRA
jgi:hypothetical protein